MNNQQFPILQALITENLTRTVLSPNIMPFNIGSLKVISGNNISYTSDTSITLGPIGVYEITIYGGFEIFANFVGLLILARTSGNLIPGSYFTQMGTVPTQERRNEPNTFVHKFVIANQSENLLINFFIGGTSNPTQLTLGSVSLTAIRIDTY